MAGSILTNIGLSKLGSATPENQLNIINIAVGDGNGGFPTLSPTMTSLTNEVWRGTASNPIRDPDNSNNVYFETNIPPDVGPFDIREIAIFDDVGDMIAIGHTSLIQKPDPVGDTNFAVAVKIFIALENASDFDLIYQNTEVTSHNALVDRNVFGAHKASSIDWSEYGTDSESVAKLKSKLTSNQGASIVLTNDNTTVQFEIDQIKSDKVDFWYTAGDGVAPDLLFDATNDLGLNVTGSDVDSIVNLGKISQGALLPTAATKSPIEVRSGFKTVKFDGSGIYDRYELTPSSFASGFFSATKKHFIMSVYVTDDRFIDTSPLSVGVTGSIAPRIDIKDPSTGSAFSLEYQDGTAIENLYQAATDRVDNSITSVSTFHNGIDEVSMWANGAVLGFKEVETKLAGQSTPTPIMNAVSVGSLLTNQFPLNGGFVAGAIDNNETLDLDSTYEKYKAAYYRFGGKAKRAFKIYVGGQSNAKGDFPNSNPFSFAAGEAYLYFQTNTGSGEGVFRRDGFTQGALKVGASCPAVWFAAELKKLIGAIPLYQDISRNGQPVSPGLPIYTEYQAPRNSVGDAAGQQSILDKWELDLVKMENLCNYSPEFNVVDKIAYLMCGESDAMAITAGATLTKKEFKTWANAWLNSLSGNYGIEKFAIVNIGRNGNTLAKVELNASAVELIREGWSEIISERADCYDVFPHLNHVPTPFVLDDLVTAEDGAWISGQANNADGLHYTTEMYKAIGITAARNFYKAINF